MTEEKDYIERVTRRTLARRAQDKISLLLEKMHLSHQKDVRAAIVVITGLVLLVVVYVMMVTFDHDESAHKALTFQEEPATTSR